MTGSSAPQPTLAVPVVDVVLGIDVGGTKTLAGLVDRAGQMIASTEFPTRTGETDDIVRVARLTADAVELWRSKRGPFLLRGIASGFPEYVSTEGRLTSHEVLTWSVQPEDALRSVPALAGIPVVIESDVRLGALGEASFGAGRGTGSLLYISLGTGLSSALVIGSSVWAGARGAAIAFGEWEAPSPSTTALPEELPSANLEAYASGTGIAGRYVALSRGALSGTMAAGGTALGGASPDDPPTTRQITVRAAAGDPIAAAVLDTAGLALGRAIAAFVDVTDPAVVVLGGGLGTGSTRIRSALERGYYAHRRDCATMPPIVTAHNGPFSGLLGAAAAAWART